MKLIYVFFGFLLVNACASYSRVANDTQSTIKAHPVRVSNWALHAMDFGPSYWDDNKDAIVEQIGMQEFEKVKANSGYKNVPSSMSIFDGKKAANASALYARLSKLKVYQIAAFTENYQGKTFDDRVILRCPYEQNSQWDKAVKWDTVYFIVNQKVVEPIEEK